MKDCCYGGGQPLKDDKDAVATLAQGHPKATPVPVKWGMKDQNAAGASLARREA